MYELDYSMSREVRPYRSSDYSITVNLALLQCKDAGMLISPSEGPTTVYLRYEFAALVRSKIPTRGCSTTWDKQGAALTRTPRWIA